MGNQEMIHWWQGYVVVRVRGNKLERLINRMMNRRFAAWNLERTSDDDAQFSITLRDFFHLRALLKETGCRVRIIKKVGLPFLFRRFRRRMGFVAGAIAFLLLMYLLSSMIWFVEIEGVRLPENEHYLRQELKAMGVKPGGFKFNVGDRQQLQQKIMERMPDVTWVGFQFKGTTAYLKVVEKTLPEIKEGTNPRHLIAKKKAIIYDIFVEQGQPMVKPNQYVKPGDVLVSGIIGTEKNPQIVSAKGKVLGEVWYESNVTVPLEQKRVVYTGEDKKRYYLNLGSFALRVWGYGKIPFEEYATSQHTRSFSFKNWTSPLGFTTEHLSATTFVEEQLTEEEAYLIGLEQARKNLQRKIQPDAEIKEENVLRKSIENGKVYIKIHYTVIEEIAKEQLLIQGD